MIRFLLQYLMPLLLPTAVFVVWILLTRKRAGDSRSVAQRLQEGPWTILIVVGLVMAIAGMGYLALNDGPDSGKTYQPLRIEDGQVIPGSSN
jgi:hypothetical protein